jgi:hypothetical protein
MIFAEKPNTSDKLPIVGLQAQSVVDMPLPRIKPGKRAVASQSFARRREAGQVKSPGALMRRHDDESHALLTIPSESGLNLPALRSEDSQDAEHFSFSCKTC